MADREGDKSKLIEPKGAASSAARIAFGTLIGVLPPNVPPAFREIVSASFVGVGRRRQIAAELQMIDGLPATVVFTRWEFGWAHRYERMPGGAMSFEGGKWVRVQDDEGGSSTPNDGARFSPVVQP